MRPALADPTTDFVRKRILGSEVPKALLIEDRRRSVAAGAGPREGDRSPWAVGMANHHGGPDNGTDHQNS
jgi:hypothetical protein